MGRCTPCIPWCRTYNSSTLSSREDNFGPDGPRDRSSSIPSPVVWSVRPQRKDRQGSFPGAVRLRSFETFQSSKDVESGSGSTGSAWTAASCRISTTGSVAASLVAVTVWVPASRCAGNSRTTVPQVVMRPSCILRSSSASCVQNPRLSSSTAYRSSLYRLRNSCDMLNNRSFR